MIASCAAEAVAQQSAGRPGSTAHITDTTRLAATGSRLSCSVGVTVRGSLGYYPTGKYDKYS